MNDIGKKILGSTTGNLALFAVMAVLLGAAKGPEFGWTLLGIALLVHLVLALPSYWVRRWQALYQEGYRAKVRERRAQRLEVMEHVLPIV